MADSNIAEILSDQGRLSEAETKFREALQAVAAARLALAPRMAAPKRAIAATVARKSVAVEPRATAAVA